VSIALSLAEASAGVVASKKRGVEGEEREGAEMKRVKTESLSTTEGDVYMGKEEGKEIKVKVEGVGRDVNSQGAGAGAGGAGGAGGGGGEGVAAAAAAATATAAAAVKTEASAAAAVTAAAATAAAAAAAAAVKEVKETDARSVTEELMAGLLRKPLAAERMAAQVQTRA
jgi:hypothetical protein